MDSELLVTQLTDIAFYFRVSLIMQGALVGIITAYIVVRYCRIRELI